ncbi:MAG: hypothetical protein ACXQS1_00750 [Methermicoccaceae archaeon]
MGKSRVELGQGQVAMRREYHVCLMLVLVACTVLLVYSSPQGALTSEENATMFVGRERMSEQYGPLSLLSYHDIASEYPLTVLRGSIAGVGLALSEPIWGSTTACVLLEYNSTEAAEIGLAVMESRYLKSYEMISTSRTSPLSLTRYIQGTYVRDPSTGRMVMVLHQRLLGFVVVVVVD